MYNKNIMGVLGSIRSLPEVFVPSINQVNLTSAWSLRLIGLGYSDNFIRVRRSADNDEQDIGFNVQTGILNTAALLSFVGAGSGFIVTWYDQKGSADMTQTAAGDQPRIVNSGTIEILTIGGRFTPRFDGTNDLVYAPAIGISGSQNRSIFTVVEQFSTRNQGIFSINADSNGAGQRYSHKLSNAPAFRVEIAGSGTVMSGASPSNNTSVIFNTIYDGNVDFYVNNVTDLNNSIGTVNTIDQDSSIGAILTSQTFNGFIAEVLLYDTDKTSDETSIRTNMNDFYNIF